jgi:6-phosphogluconolactonase
VIPIYIGTYTDAESRGIYRLALDGDGAQLSAPVLVAPAENPSFLAWHPSRPVLYTVCETHDPAATKPSAVLAYAVDAAGDLALINKEPSGGLGACFVSVHPAGTHVFVANYRTGSVAVFPVRSDGGLAPASALVEHRGSSVHATRQQRPYAHSIRMAPGNRFVLAADLGADRLFVYRFDPVHGTLILHDPAAAVAAPGAGPRHVTAHPSGHAVILVNELNSTLASYAWDGARGTLDLRALVSTLPDGFSGENTAAEVAVHPSGRFVYSSNRGHDSIAAFRAGREWTLTPAGAYSTGGRTPRHFAIDPSGDLLLVANQESDSLVLFRLDRETGALADTGARARVPSPAFVAMPASVG